MNLGISIGIVEVPVHSVFADRLVHFGASIQRHFMGSVPVGGCAAGGGPGEFSLSFLDRDP